MIHILQIIYTHTQIAKGLPYAMFSITLHKALKKYSWVVSVASSYFLQMIQLVPPNTYFKLYDLVSENKRKFLVFLYMCNYHAEDD